MRIENMDKKRKSLMFDEDRDVKILVSFAILFSISITLLSLPVILKARASENNQNEDGIIKIVHESNPSKNAINEEVKEEIFDHDTVIPSANALPDIKEETKPEEIAEESKEIEEETVYIAKWSEEEAYLLAKIAMAEAEGESLQTKILVILTVLNRVEFYEFPDTIKEVIFEKHTKNGKDVYQFSPTKPGGRWWRVEPNEECWKAVEIVSTMQEDISNGALYFESCSGESWHSRNLKLICQSDDMRFYKYN